MGYVFLIAALVLNAGANLLMKAGADRLAAAAEPLTVVTVAGNYPLLAGLLLFALNVLLYVAALTRLDLSVAYPIMTAGGVLLVVSASALVFREALTVTQIVGVLVLAGGIVLVSWRGPA